MNYQFDWYNICRVQPTRCNFSQFIYFCRTLYMFQMAFPSICQTNTWRCMCIFELLMMDGKNCLKHAQRLTEINKLWNVASCWLYSVNILTIHGPINVKLIYISLLITVVGVVEASVFKVPPQMRSWQIGFSVLPTFIAHGIMSQSSMQVLGPTVPTLDGIESCPCVLPERVNACVRLFTERQHTWIYMWSKLMPGLRTTSIADNLCYLHSQCIKDLLSCTDTSADSVNFAQQPC